ncbi:restriction endonuclease subunit S [Thauera sp.]|uniref:restriction endonuclease subunit S n=1 Tax=Thauera sp. TaxID=1905334 RepID=UPI002B839908|nr:restriction endonuclease subunit S [Thauera sp.]HRO35164.1 restriction endonuclease subunit S [Thauera sp.]
MKTLLDLCELIVDCEHKTAPLADSGYPSIRTPNVGRGRLILNGVNRVSEETYLAWSRRATPQADDLIIAREAPLGNVAIIPRGLKVCLGQRTVLVRPDKQKVDPSYLCYFLLGDYAQGRFRGASIGATVPHLNMKDIRGLLMPKLPSLEEQRRIASILSAYDDLIENNTRRIAILEEMARGIFEEWFVRFRFPGHEQVKMVESELGLIPEGWTTCRLDDVLVLQRGFDLPRQARTEGSFPIISATGESGTHNEFRVRGPGVVTGRSGSLGTVMYVESDFWPLNTTLWVKEFKVGSPLYAFYVLQSIDLAGYNSGAAVPTLNRNDVHRFPVLKSTPNVLLHFDAIAGPMLKLKRRLEQKNANLRATRDLLLPKLISGELYVSTLPEPEEGIAA